MLDWEAYAELEPFSERRADIRTAQIVAMMANLWARSAKHHPEPYTIKEFLLPFSEDGSTLQPKQKQSWEEQEKLLLMMAGVTNASRDPAEVEAAKAEYAAAAREFYGQAEESRSH